MNRNDLKHKLKRTFVEQLKENKKNEKHLVFLQV